MIIDCILDRKDGVPYSPNQFYNDVLAYENLNLGTDGYKISRAMDSGTEEEVKRLLCEYVIRNEYNPQICDYVNSVNWIPDDLL